MMPDHTHFAQPPTPLPLLQATQRVFAVRRLFFEGAVDRRAALLSIDTIYTQATNPRLRNLCETVAFSFYPELRTARSRALTETAAR